MTIDKYTDMHDGSPLGNDLLSKSFVKEHKELALCPDVGCEYWPNHYKCFQESGFNRCVTYLRRKSVQLKLGTELNE